MGLDPNFLVTAVVGVVLVLTQHKFVKDKSWHLQSLIAYKLSNRPNNAWIIDVPWIVVVKSDRQCLGHLSYFRVILIQSLEIFSVFFRARKQMQTCKFHSIKIWTFIPAI